jgi:hypothetical protein
VPLVGLKGMLRSKAQVGDQLIWPAQTEMPDQRNCFRRWTAFDPSILSTVRGA